VDLATLRGEGEEEQGEEGEPRSDGEAVRDAGEERHGRAARNGNGKDEKRDGRAARNGNGKDEKRDGRAARNGNGEERDGRVPRTGGETKSGGLSPHRFAFLDDELHVSAETVRRLSCGGSRVVMLNDGEGGVLDVGRKTRAVPSALARAVRFRDRGRCRFPGCTAPGRDHHHAVHWARGGETKLENLVLLCWFHHRAVHETSEVFRQ